MFWRKKDKSSPSESSASTNPFESSDASSVAAPSYTSTTGSEYPPSYTSSPAPSRGGGRYGTRHNDAEYESQQRNELFGDRPSRGAPAGGRYGGGYDDNNDQYGSRYAQQQQEEEDEEVGNIKTQIRNVKQDTLASTRNALQKIHETEQTAANTMNMLGQQSTQLANVDRNLDLSKAYSDRAANQADELKQLNRSIFIPVVKNPFTRNKRQQRELDALKRDQQEHMEERDRIRQFEYESNARMEQAQKRNERVSANAGYHRGRSESDRRRYQFEADEEDDAIEDEIDQNLDLLGGATARLKNMALTMNEEIDSQNRQLDKLNPKIDPLTQKLASTTHKLNKTK